MNKKNCCKKIFCFILVFAIVLEIPGFASIAVDKYLVYVNSYIIGREEEFWLPILNVDGDAYITASEALRLSGMDKYQEDGGSVIFCKGYHEVTFSGDSEIYEGVLYYDLEEIMEDLSTCYTYIPESELLLFSPCEAFFENLIYDCEAIFSDRYDISYLGNSWGYACAAIYNILFDARIDYIWGKYSREQYETALIEIMQIDETKSSIVDLGIEGDSIMSRLSTIYELNQTDMDGIRNYCELFGMPYDDIIEAYDVFNNAIPYYNIGDFLDIAQKVYATQNAYEVYVNAIKYGVEDNPFIEDNNLKKAANKVYSYYDDQKPVLADIIKDSVGEIANNAVSDLIKYLSLEAMKNYGLKITSIYTKATKEFFDGIGMGKMTKAVEQSHACAEIQRAARLKYKNRNCAAIGMNDYRTEKERAIDAKYSTILYLRACQYAYSLYSFDDSLKWASEFWTQKTESAIQRIAQYSDADLLRVVNNEKLDLSEQGFLNERPNFEDTASYIGRWGADYILGGIFSISLYINDVQDNNIFFDIEYYKTYGYENQVVTINPDGSAEFFISNEDTFISGVFQFGTNCIEMTVEESTMEYILIGTTVFVKTDSAQLDSGLVIEIRWNGTSDLTDELLVLDFLLSGNMDSGEVFDMSDSPNQIKDKSGNIIANVEHKLWDQEGAIIITLYRIDGCFNLCLTARDPEMSNLNEIAESNASVLVYYPNSFSGYRLNIDDYKETQLNRSYTGVWCWDVFTIDHGIVKVSDSAKNEITEYIGENIDAVISDFGSGYIDDYLHGGHGYFYEGLNAGFIFDEKGIIYVIVAWGNLDYGHGLSGNMTYPEIVAALPDYKNIGEPHFFYDLHDDCYKYSLGLTINGYSAIYYWFEDPYINKSYSIYFNL